MPLNEEEIIPHYSHPPTSKIKRARATPLTQEGIIPHYNHPPTSKIKWLIID